MSRKSVPHEIAEERNWERIIPSASLERGKVRCLRQNVSLNHISCYFSCQHCVSSWKVGVWNEALDLWIIESTRYSDQFQLVSLDRSFFFFFFFSFIFFFFFLFKKIFYLNFIFIVLWNIYTKGNWNIVLLFILLFWWFWFVRLGMLG